MRSWPTLAMSLALFAALYYVLCLRYGVLELEMEVPEFASFKIYWAQGESGYSESRSHTRALSPERTVHRFLVRHPWFLSRVRLDPAPGAAPFRIESLRLIAFGGLWPAPGGVPGSAITARRDILQLETEGTAVLVISDNGDPQLEVAVTTPGLRQPAQTGILLLAAVVVLHWPLTRLAGAVTAVAGRRRVLVGCGLALAALWLLSPSVTMFSPGLQGGILIPAATLLAVALGPPQSRWLALVRPLLAARQLVTVGFLVTIFGLGTAQLGLLPDFPLAVARMAAEQDDNMAVARDAPDAIGKFFERNFRSRELLLHANGMLKIEVFGASPSSTALLGRNGFFFEGYGERRVEDGVVRSFDNVTDYLGLSPFAEDELEQWARTVTERRQWLAARGIPYVFALAPTKGLIYSEYLPSRLQSLNDPNRPTRFDQLADHLERETDVPIVDLKRTLLEAKANTDGRLLYYKTDFHWNFIGAFHAYRAIIDEAAARYPALALEPLAMDEFRVEVDRDWVHRRFLGTLGIIPEYFPGEDYIRLVPRDGSRVWRIEGIPEDGIYDIIRRKTTLTHPDHGTIEVDMIHNPAGRLDTIVVLGDSFIEKSLWFFAAHARRTIFVRSVLHFRTGIFDFVQPDLVVQEILNMYLLRPPPVNIGGVAQ